MHALFEMHQMRFVEYSKSNVPSVFLAIKSLSCLFIPVIARRAKKSRVSISLLDLENRHSAVLVRYYSSSGLLLNKSALVLDIYNRCADSQNTHSECRMYFSARWQLKTLYKCTIRSRVWIFTTALSKRRLKPPSGDGVRSTSLV